jgi:alpha-L-arabinofuranosidase
MRGSGIMISFQNSKKYILPFVALLVTNGLGQSTMTFNVDGATTVVPKEIFGLLMERLGRQWSNNGIFVGTTSTIPNTNGMRNDVIEGFKECGVGAAQWPGGCAANGYNWSSSKKPSNDVGVDRFIEFCKLTGAEAIISGKPTGNDAASNLAFAQYIIDSLKYPLKWFKIGNEIWGGCGTTYTSGYTDGFTANCTALKALQSHPNGNDLKFIAAAGATEGNYGWIPNYFTILGATMNAIEFHDYIYYPSAINGTNPTTANYWQIMNDVFVGDFHGHLFNNIIPAMNTADASKKIKICFDEWGDWLTNLEPGSCCGMQSITLMDAISAGGHLNQFIQNADRVGVACLAQGVNVIHSIININTSGVMVKTPAFYVFKMYKPHQTNNAKFAPMTASNIEKANGTVPALSAAASVDAGSYVNISLTNCDLSATRPATVTLTSSHAEYRVVSAEVITGSAYTSTNPFGAAEQVNIQPLAASTYSVSGKTLTVTMPKTSVVMIRLLPTDVAVQPRSLGNKRAAAFSIKAGSRGSVLITSSLSRKTPVTISLYGMDGRTLISRTSRIFKAGSSTCVLKNTVSGNGVYLVKITGADVNLSKQIAGVR